MSIVDPGHTNVPYVIVDSVNKPTYETTHIIMLNESFTERKEEKDTKWNQ